MSAPVVDLPAGRLLDAVVAEKVMGWRWVTFVGHSYLVPSPHHQFPEWDAVKHFVWPGSSWTEGKTGEPDYEWAHLPKYARSYGLPHYSKDIAAAWEVVEKLNASERWPDIQFGPAESGYECWHVALVNPADVEVADDTAPLAICRAALKAVGA